MSEKDSDTYVKKHYLKDDTCPSHIDPKKSYDWDIFGEDSNTSWGGESDVPHLMTVRGTFSEAQEKAKSIKRYFVWGSGGHISLSNYQEKEEEKEMTLPTAEEMRAKMKEQRASKAKAELAGIVEVLLNCLADEREYAFINIRYTENIDELRVAGYAVSAENSADDEYKVSWGENEN